MNILKKSILILISIFISLCAQEENQLKDLVSNYKNFEFEKVIILSDSLLNNKEQWENHTLLEVVELRSASFFALGDQNGTRKSFIDLLKIDGNYELSASEYSPKLISLFREVKAEFKSIMEDDEENDSRNSEKFITEKASLKYMDYKSAMAKSLLIPGWGHFEIGKNTKGLLLTSLGLASLGSMVYYIFDAESKESDYLNESNQDLIQRKYDDYNTSYRIRNTLIITYAAIWLYSQIDLLLFDDSGENKQVRLLPGPNIYGNDNTTVLSVRISF